MVTINVTNFSFVVNNEKKSFKVYHNLPDVHGLNINDAFINWVYRTPEYTAESFCDYVCSKGSGYFCITQEQYDRIHKEDDQQ